MKLKYTVMAFAAMTGAASAVTTILVDNTTRNGSFEAEAGSGKLFFITPSINSWSNWAEEDTADDDTGTDAPSGAPDGSQIDGTRIAFLQPGGAILNETAYVIQAGDVFTYGFANTLAGRANATVSLALGTTRIAASDQSLAPENINQGYSYAATPGDVGQTISIGLISEGSWPEVDQVFLSVESVPEPSSAALLGLGGLALVMRRRK